MANGVSARGCAAAACGQVDSPRAVHDQAREPVAARSAWPPRPKLGWVALVGPGGARVDEEEALGSQVGARHPAKSLSPPKSGGSAGMPRGASSESAARRRAPSSATGSLIQIALDGSRRSARAAPDAVAQGRGPPSTPDLWLPIRSTTTSGAKRAARPRNRGSSEVSRGQRARRQARRRTTRARRDRGWPRAGAPSSSRPPSRSWPRADGVAGRSARGRQCTTSPRALVRMRRMRMSALGLGEARPRAALERACSSGAGSSLDGASQFGRRRYCRARLVDHHSGGVVGEHSGLERTAPGGPGQREGSDHGVAGAGDVGDLPGSDDRDVGGRPPRRAPCRGCRGSPAGSRRRAAGSRLARAPGASSSPIDARRQSLDLFLVGRGALMPAEVARSVAAVAQRPSRGR